MERTAKEGNLKVGSEMTLHDRSNYIPKFKSGITN